MSGNVRTDYITTHSVRSFQTEQTILVAIDKNIRPMPT